MSWQIRRWKEFQGSGRQDDRADIWRLEHVDDGKDRLPELTLHLDGNIAAAVDLSTLPGEDVAITITSAPTKPTTSAIRLVLSTEDGMQITVDTTPGSESVSAQYEDDKDDTTAAPADADLSTWVFTSDDPSALAVGATTPLADGTGATAPLTPGAEGGANISLAGTFGSNAQGQPIAAPAPIAIPVVAGPAASLVLGEVDTPATTPPADSSSAPAGA